LKNVKDASDANSIAGLLKLYFRELREPLFPFYLFDLITGKQIRLEINPVCKIALQIVLNALQ
jgi:hypothetical protein